MTALLIAMCVAVALFATAGLVVLAIVGDHSSVEARLREVTTRHSSRVPYGLKDVLSYLNRALQPLRRLLGLKGDEVLAYRLSLAGYREPGNLDTFLNAKLLGPAVGVLLATFAGKDNLLATALVLGTAGFLAPNLLLNRAIKHRKQAVARSLPDAIDLLIICMEAGLGIDQAVLRIANDLATVCPELCDELQIIGREQRAGKARADAWRAMADRLDLNTVDQFAGMLVQSERLGTPIAQSLGQFANDMRAKRLLQAEERAAKTSIKMLPPMVAFIFPAMFVVILGPSIIAFENVFR
jgi:tight adherence protein C